MTLTGYKVKLAINKNYNGEIDSTYKDEDKAKRRVKEFNTSSSKPNMKAFVEIMTEAEIEKYGYNWKRNSKKKLHANESNGMIRHTEDK